MKTVPFGAVVGLLLLSLVFKSSQGSARALGKVEFQFLSFARVLWTGKYGKLSRRIQPKGQVSKYVNFSSLF